MLLKRKKWYYDVVEGVHRLKRSRDLLNLPCIVTYCNVCMHQRSHVLVRMYADSCLFDCLYCKQNSIGGKRKMKNEKKTNESVSKNTDSKNDTTNPSIIEADDINKIPSIEDILPNGEVFSHPLLEEFLGGAEKKQAVLTEAEIITGGYGESVTLKLDGNMYRSNSKTIVHQVKTLQDMKKIPIRVNVAQVKGKTGRTYFTLRG